MFWSLGYDISTVRTNMIYFESLLTITRIILHPNEEESFLIKFIKIKFQSYSGIESCLSNL